MQINGLQCQVNLPDAPKGEGVYGLPPYNIQSTYVVDEYPACPTNWMHGSGKAASYFFPVGKGKHLWLDFNQNWGHTHHIAIVLSVQGINPITGQQSKVLRLEQYREKCPIHQDEAFKQDRFCEKCEFKWPPQNYMTTVSTPHRLLWVDGWRIEDGTIRGFLITAETMKGIATQIIGEDRVWSIGIAFYLSKIAKPAPSHPTRSVTIQGKGMGFSGNSPTLHSAPESKGYSSTIPIASDSLSADMEMEASTSSKPRSSRKLRSAASGQSVQRQVETEKLEIAAGAKITQELAHYDPNNLDFYEDQPAGLIYANYCSLDDFEKIIAEGTRDMTKEGEGPLHGLDVGNSTK